MVTFPHFCVKARLASELHYTGVDCFVPENPCTHFSTVKTRIGWKIQNFKNATFRFHSIHKNSHTDWQNWSNLQHDMQGRVYWTKLGGRHQELYSTEGYIATQQDSRRRSTSLHFLTSTIMPSSRINWYVLSKSLFDFVL